MSYSTDVTWTCFKIYGVWVHYIDFLSGDTKQLLLFWTKQWVRYACTILKSDYALRIEVSGGWYTYSFFHDDVIKWKHYPRYWPFVRGIHWSPVNSPHKGQWRGALMFSLICVWINGCVNSWEAGDLRRYRAHYDVTVMSTCFFYLGWHYQIHHHFTQGIDGSCP